MENDALDVHKDSGTSITNYNNQENGAYQTCTTFKMRPTLPVSNEELEEIENLNFLKLFSSGVLHFMV